MIVEDEINILKYMEKKLSEFEDFQVKGAFSVPEKALEGFCEIQPDVVFLDIEMPRINGIEMARKLLKKKHDIYIIFTTAYGQYALDAFEVEAIDYLMKPIASEDIVRVIKRLNKVTRGKHLEKASMEKEHIVPVRCFGCFEVRDSQQQLVNWPTRKAEEVFAYFLTRQGKHISKWELLELFWPDIEIERGLHNLHNTIYRIKQVLKNVSKSATIQKLNDGYILESKEVLSDLEQLLLFLEKRDEDIVNSIEKAKSLFFSYMAPLFGSRDYMWSFSLQKYVAGLYKKLCNNLLSYYAVKNQFDNAEEIIRYYVQQHVEDETIMSEFIKLLRRSGHEKKVIEYQIWFNERLMEAELPPLRL